MRRTQPQEEEEEGTTLGESLSFARPSGLQQVTGRLTIFTGTVVKQKTQGRS